MFRNWSGRSSLLSSSLTSLSSLTSYSSSHSWSHQSLDALSTALHDAAAVSALNVLSRASRQQLSAKDNSGRTPGMIAAEKGNLEALALIHKRGDKSDKQDYLGESALHLAAKNDNSACVKYLLNAKHTSCNPYALDDQRLTPREAAELAKATQSADILREFERELGERNLLRADQMLREAEKQYRKYKLKRDKRVEQSQISTNRSLNLKPAGLDGNEQISPLSSRPSRYGHHQDYLKRNNRYQSPFLVRKNQDWGVLSPSQSFQRSLSEFSLPTSNLSASSGSNLFTKNRPSTRGDELALSLSQIDFGSPQSDTAVIENFENIDLSPGSSVLDVEDPFSFCEKREITEPDDSERLRFFLDSHGLGELYPTMIIRGYTYEKINSLKETDFNKLKIDNHTAKKMLCEVLKMRTTFDLQIKSLDELIDVKL